MHGTRQMESTAADELVSALADGELRGAELMQALAELEGNDAARANWHAYHVVGELMRSGPAAAVGPHDPDFVARLRGRLAADVPQPENGMAVSLPLDALRSANDAVWRWKLVAGLCALTVVGVLGWQLLAMQRPDAGGGAQLAAVQAPGLTLQRGEDGGPLVIRDPQLDRLIAEHQQLGGTSALQMPAGFLRNATFERPAR